MTENKSNSEVEGLKKDQMLQQQDLVKQMLDIEEKRIESIDKKTENAKLFILKSDEADQRQYLFQMERLRNQENENKRKHKLVKTIIIGGGLFVIAFLGILCWFAFNGDKAQSDNAIKCFSFLFTAVGGYGVFQGTFAAIKKLLNKDS